MTLAADDSPHTDPGAPGEDGFEGHERRALG
jgi:hypothetical protein